MKLLTEELKDKFKKIGKQDITKDPLIISKFFNPCGAGIWYATEWKEKDQMFFGFVSIFGDHDDEWAYFSLAELEAVKGCFGLGIERDLHFGYKQASEIPVIAETLD